MINVCISLDMFAFNLLKSARWGSVLNFILKYIKQYYELYIHPIVSLKT